MSRLIYGLQSTLCRHSRGNTVTNLGKPALLFATRQYGQHTSKQTLLLKNALRRTNSNSTLWRSCFLGLGLVSAAAFYINRRQMTVKAASPPINHMIEKGLREKHNFIADIVEKVSPAVVLIQTSSYFRQGSGSGFIISSDGLIVTNAHVVQSARHGQVTVELPNGKKYNGEVQFVDHAGDLALVKIHDVNLPTIELAVSESLRPGEWVVAVGCPLSLSNTVTSGIVSSTGRKSSQLGMRNSVNYIQTDAPITFGNSGGPLINLDGEAVGVNTLKVTEGISFAIPSDYVKNFLTKAAQHKKDRVMMRLTGPPYIGIAAITLSPHLAAQLRHRLDIKDIDRGVFVVEVNDASPAQQAGLIKHDIILKVDDRAVDDFNDLISTITDKSIAKFTVYRNGTIKEMHIRPQRQQST
ncbi:serine protease HTRA1-like [Watersipora subatra]|uniref:serine protease HTRA1-like n=1 Tax=Watersipora subatra TaxID=2589382 RepID=UPI00355B63FB